MKRSEILARSARVSFALLLALVADGCAGQPSNPTRTNPEPPGQIVLAAKDSSSTATMQTGQLLQITLDANPTTGYDWAIDGDVPAQLKQSGAPRLTSSSSAIGAGGIETWSFDARAVGTGTLRLKYWRSFEASTPPVRTFTVDVVVK